MHYKNGREAKEGDSIIGTGWVSSKVGIFAGTLHSLSANPDCKTCNGMLCVPIVGGAMSISVTIGECFHAQDAFDAIAALQPKPEPVVEPLPMASKPKTT